MISKTLRGLAAALLIGSATVASVMVMTVTVAEAGVRPAVGKPLQQAIELAKEGKGSAAMAKVHEAEGVGGLSAEEQRVVEQTKQFVAVKTGSGGGALGAKAKFANDYNAGRYRDVVGADQDELRKAGSLDDNSRLIVAQAYYLMGQYKAAIQHLDSLGDSSTVLELKMASANKLGDNTAQADAARQLVLKGQTKYWVYLLSAADHGGGLDDEGTLGVYRLRLLTGNMRGAEDYSTATQIAIQLGYPQEALSIQQKGFDAKVLSGERQQRLLDLAKKTAADQASKMGALMGAAQAAKTGDELAHMAEVYWGLGKFADAVNAADAAIKKGGLKNPSLVLVAQGMAYLGEKKASDASRVFKKAGADPKYKTIGDLWDVYTRSAK